MLFVMLTIAVLFTSFVFDINSRFDNKEYVYVNNDKGAYVKQSFFPLEVIKVKGLSNSVLVASDSLRTEVSHDDQQYVQITHRDDTLEISSAAYLRQKFFIYLPDGARVVAEDSKLEIKGSLNYNRWPGYHISLTSSSLRASDGGTHVYFDYLDISGNDDSQITMDKSVHIRRLELTGVKDVRLSRGWQIDKLIHHDGGGDALHFYKLADSVALVQRDK